MYYVSMMMILIIYILCVYIIYLYVYVIPWTNHGIIIKISSHLYIVKKYYQQMLILKTNQYNIAILYIY